MEKGQTRPSFGKADLVQPKFDSPRIKRLDAMTDVEICEMILSSRGRVDRTTVELAKRLAMRLGRGPSW